MCKFFSFVTDGSGNRFYSDWNLRKSIHKSNPENIEPDSHTSICKLNSLNEDKVNKFEFNPITKSFVVDQINCDVDDRIQAEEWVNQLDFKTIVKPLIIKPIINPLSIKTPEIVPNNIIKLMKQYIKNKNLVYDSVCALFRDSDGDLAWVSVWASISTSVRDSVRDSICASVCASVGDSVGDSVRHSVWNSVWDFIYCYYGSFFDIKFQFDITPVVKLWEAGYVVSFDGENYNLHSSPKAIIIYQIKKD